MNNLDNTIKLLNASKEAKESMRKSMRKINNKHLTKAYKEQLKCLEDFDQVIQEEIKTHFKALES